MTSAYGLRPGDALVSLGSKVNDGMDFPPKALRSIVLGSRSPRRTRAPQPYASRLAPCAPRLVAPRAAALRPAPRASRPAPRCPARRSPTPRASRPAPPPFRIGTSPTTLP